MLKSQNERMILSNQEGMLETKEMMRRILMSQVLEAGHHEFIISSSIAPKPGRPCLDFCESILGNGSHRTA